MQQRAEVAKETNRTGIGKAEWAHFKRTGMLINRLLTILNPRADSRQQTVSAL
jgi:hypothetical protein